MSMFDSFSKKFTETAMTAAKKSSELFEIARLNMNIELEQSKMNKVLAEIGKLMYEKFENQGSLEDQIVQLCEKVKEHKATVEDIRKKIDDVKGKITCSSCGEIMETGIFVCKKCGAKREEEPIVVEEVLLEKTCAKCGNVCPTSHSFCFSCGSKLS